MAEGARVDDLDALVGLRVALVKFAETGLVSLDSAEAEISSVLNWLENEQTSYWQTQIRRRQEAFSKAEEALRSKRLFKDSSGRIPQAIEEMKAVKIAKIRIEEAQAKYASVRKYIPKLQREYQNYKGGVQRFATSLQTSVPMATAALDSVISKLAEYVNLRAPAMVTSSSNETDSSRAFQESVSSMARGDDEIQPTIADQSTADKPTADKPTADHPGDDKKEET
jgi:hypothetical protein